MFIQWAKARSFGFSLSKFGLLSFTVLLLPMLLPFTVVPFARNESNSFWYNCCLLQSLLVALKQFVWLFMLWPLSSIRLSCIRSGIFRVLLFGSGIICCCCCCWTLVSLFKFNFSFSANNLHSWCSRMTRLMACSSLCNKLFSLYVNAEKNIFFSFADWNKVR